MLKKIIIGILVVVIIAAAGLLLVGLLNPTVSYESKVEINKPREVVWAYFTDVSKMGDWLPGFQKIETISGNPNQVGSKYKMTFIEDGKEIILNETVTGYRENELFAFDLEHEIMSNKVEVTAADNGGKTVLTQKEEVAGANIFWRILFVLSKSTFEDRSQTVLDKLKSNIESQ